MDVYDDYATREELMSALEGAITRRDAGNGSFVWRFDATTRDAMTRRYESASQSAAQERRRREEAEAQLRDARGTRRERGGNRGGIATSLRGADRGARSAARAPQGGERAV